MPTNLQILSDEIANDPLPRGYSDMDDQEVTDSINTEDRTTDGEITAQEFTIWTGGNERLFRLGQSEASGASNSIKNRAAAMVAVVRYNTDSIDLTNSNLISLINGLVTDNTWAASDKTSLLALGVNTISRAQELGLPPVSKGNVTSARGV